MMKDELVNLYNIPVNKIKVLFPPLDTQKFNINKRKNRDTLRKKFNMLENIKYFVFVSSGHKRKGLRLLLDIFKELEAEKYQLIIAGTPTIYTTIKNIKYIGFIEDASELYVAADYTIHPAVYEPFGQIISESLACGTPVIVSEMVGAAEVLGDKDGIVVKGFDYKDWAKVIREIDTYKLKADKDFVTKNNLSIERHINAMLEEWDKRK